MEWESRWMDCSRTRLLAWALVCPNFTRSINGLKKAMGYRETENNWNGSKKCWAGIKRTMEETLQKGRPVALDETRSFSQGNLFCTARNSPDPKRRANTTGQKDNLPSTEATAMHLRRKKSKINSVDLKSRCV
ncbi:hypothetical protein AVEN_245473-1 [Araneus ventricosus]|uniref:Uncharacterized protein n=1 Tax=Araneus ventricosus TaxID=182803 RepID=A0A4Y2D5L4_ARAVE|nr:hypothetical protein AVEN_245473-1 [Araneus ventricosus]